MRLCCIYSGFAKSLYRAERVLTAGVESCRPPRERLPETRIEIVTGVTEAATIPWELLREPSTTSVLALTAHSFVRAQPNAARAPHLPTQEAGKIRIS